MEPFCCDDMQREAEQTCQRHGNRFDCPDCLVDYSEQFRESGLIVHDGGSPIIRIHYCPWCGTRLPESLRRVEANG